MSLKVYSSYPLPIIPFNSTLRYMKEETKTIIFILITVFILSSFTFGVFISFVDLSFKKEQCHYQMYISYYNPFYRIGCELFKVRY